MCPVNTFANFTSREVIPVLFIRFPAKMNSGIASMVKDCVVDKERCTKIVHGISGLVKKNAKPETAMANATGMPKNNITKKNPTAPSISYSPILSSVF